MSYSDRTAITCDRCGKIIAYDEGLRLVFLDFKTGAEILVIDAALKSARCTHSDSDGRRCYARFSWYPSKQKKQVASQF